MKKLWITAGVAVAVFLIVGPGDAYAGTLRMLLPFLSTDQRLKARTYAAPAGIAAGALAWHFLG